MRIPRAITVVALALAASIGLASCATAGDDGGPDPQLRGQWQLSSGRDAAGSLELTGQLFSLTINRDSSTSGRSACSRYTARVLGAARDLTVTTEHPANPNCPTPQQRALENRYFADLDRVHRATVSKSGLLQLSANGIVLDFARAEDPPTSRISHRAWVLAWTGTPSFVAGQTPAFVNIDYGPGADVAVLRFTNNGTANNGTATASTGCARITARYAQDAGTLVMSDISRTGRGGCDAQSQRIDRTMMSAFRSGFSYELSGGILTTVATRIGVLLVYSPEQ